MTQRLRVACLLVLCWGGAGPAAPAGLYGPTASFPPAALFSNRDLLDPPAGRHGFLTTTPDGSLRFQDGVPARFWGINLVHEHIVRPEADIGALADLFADVGINLVRFHQLDDPRSLLVDGRIAEERLAQLDRWVAALASRGIYSVLELHTYRGFSREQGVLNAARLSRGGKPYLLFDRRLQQEWLDFATRLLTHYNPLRGCRYVDDPAVAVVELYGENGLVLKRKEWRRLAMPYQAFLMDDWNRWLKRRYGGTEALRAAWGEGALQPRERLEDASIELPDYESGPSLPLRSPARRQDGLRFAADVHRDFFRWAGERLRELGVKVPLTASGDQDALPELWAAAQDLDLIAASFYWDHPRFPQTEWRLPALLENRSEVSESSTNALLPFLAVSHVVGKPLMVYEWNYCYPNRFRAEGPLQMAAAGRWQGWDALLAFHYSTRPARHASLEPFDLRTDAARWGLMAHAARLFLTDMVAPARRRVTLAYPGDAPFRSLGPPSPLHQLAWQLQTMTGFDFSPSLPGDYYLRSGDGWRSAGEGMESPNPLRTSWVSDTGEIRRDSRRGCWQLVTPAAVAFTGSLKDASPLQLGPFRIECSEPFGVLVAIALDGRPLADSQRVTLKFVTHVEQAGSVIEKRGDRWQLTRYGSGPLKAGGRLQPSAFRMEWQGRGVFEVPQQGGLWELLWQTGQPLRFWSDTEGVKPTWQTP